MMKLIVSLLALFLGTFSLETLAQTREILTDEKGVLYYSHQFFPSAQNGIYQTRITYHIDENLAGSFKDGDAVNAVKEAIHQSVLLTVTFEQLSTIGASDAAKRQAYLKRLHDMLCVKWDAFSGVEGQLECPIRDVRVTFYNLPKESS